MWQMLTESTLLTAAGTAAGLLAAQGVLSGLLALGPTLPRIEEIRLDGAVMLFTAAVAILTAAVAGLFPALRASRSEAADTLRSGGRSSAGDRRSLPWQLLVSTEVAMALILLIGAGLLIRSFSAIVGIDSGIDPRGVLTVDISVPRANHPDDPSLISFYSRLLNEIESLPGVEGAGIINHLPFSDMWMNGGFMIEGVGEAPGYAHYRAVSGGYFDAMGIPMLRGRSFTAGDQAGGPGVVVVNEAFADAFFPGEEALGKRIGNLANDQWAYGDEWLTIVGVAGNVRHTGLTEPAPGAVYVNAMQRPMQARAAVLAVKATGSVSLAGSVRARLREIDPDVPVAISSMDAVLGRSTADRRFLMLVLGSFSTVALVLATVGIYGVVSYAVARRTREMGIRIALGAEPGKVRALVIRNSMGMVAAGIAMGAVGALLLSGLLRNLVFEISPSDPLTFVLVTVLLAGAALLASYVPALRGSRVDPMVTMRSE